jgi:hypothetical protein
VVTPFGDVHDALEHGAETRAYHPPRYPPTT